MTERRLGDLGGAGVSPPWGTKQRQQAAVCSWMEGCVRVEGFL